MKSLRVRLLLALLAMLALAAAAMGLLTYRSVLAETEALFDYQLRQMALSLRDQGEIAPEQARAFADDDLDFVVQVWSIDGRSVYQSRPHPELPARAALGFADISAGGQTWRTFGVATPLRVIQVAQPLTIRKRLAADAALHAVFPLLLIAPVLALVVWWVTKVALRPLAELAGEVQGRDGQSLAPLPTQGLPEEVSPLVAAFNQLLERLSQSLDAQRAFVGDAAHELRSPLTALKLQLQLLRRAGDDASREEALAALSTGIERATRLVEQLLALARSEPGATAMALSPLDLSEVVRQAMADTVPLALSRGVELELFADQPVPVQGERTSLAVLVRNLVDNAVRYSPKGARVELRVLAEQGHATVHVDDAGPGIPPSERGRVFDRFYRRASNDEPGSGLGLAIVKGVATRHGATVSLSDSPLGGLRVTVQLPMGAA
ncbi:ATP-binding protein [Piscinibacter terrae]|uniref:histidine kinase n=1 Tax=Piscinibacter terrae TaxID=2496871 RepID=A0A3N7HUQ1_9BURK|nr:ATP-binding protein [Albitalea terrae]RQP26050.1 HAMP domain-containing protein [Albitalea terrae]